MPIIEIHVYLCISRGVEHMIYDVILYQLYGLQIKDFHHFDSIIIIRAGSIQEVSKI